MKEIMLTFNPLSYLYLDAFAVHYTEVWSFWFGIFKGQDLNEG